MSCRIVVLPARGGDNQSALTLSHWAEKVKHRVVIRPSLASDSVCPWVEWSSVDRSGIVAFAPSKSFRPRYVYSESLGFDGFVEVGVGPDDGAFA